MVNECDALTHVLVKREREHDERIAKLENSVKGMVLLVCVEVNHFFLLVGLVGGSNGHDEG